MDIIPILGLERLCLVTQSCPTLCYTMDCSLSGYSVLRILQQRILEWVAIPSSRGSFQSMDRTDTSCIAGGFFTTDPLWKPKRKVGTNK